MSKVQIRCQVLLGLFDSEYYVLVNGSSAYYINRDEVKILKGGTPSGDKSVEGLVVGYVVGTQDDKTLVQLPGEPVVGNVRTWVESSAVLPA